MRKMTFKSKNVIKCKKIKNKISYSNLQIPKTYLSQNEHRTESFRKCKAHRNPSPSYKNLEYKN
jgi:hypothetical protein